MTLHQTPHPAVYPGLPSLTASAAPAPGVYENTHRGAFSARMQNLERAHVATRQPVAACGWHWPSQTDAARALGVERYHVTRALDRGRFDRLVMERLGINSAAAGLPPPVDN